jgi:hypothetical protein
MTAQQLAAAQELRALAQPAGQADMAALRAEVAQLRDVVQQLVDALVPRADGMVVGVAAQRELLALLKEQEARRGRQQAGSAS